jgi:hypothetical protein
MTWRVGTFFRPPLADKNCAAIRWHFTMQNGQTPQTGDKYPNHSSPVVRVCLNPGPHSTTNTLKANPNRLAFFAYYCVFVRVPAGSCGLRREPFLPATGRFYPPFEHSHSDPPHPLQVEVRKARPSLRYKSTTYARTVGLENGHAAADIRDLRGLIEAWRDARRTAWQTAVKVVTTGVQAALLVGVAIKLKLMGGPQ